MGSGEEFPLYSEVANSLCCTFFKLTLAVSMSYITTYL